ncbi:MAG: TolC family outer membrane protein [Alphaproteobacteria bacterium]|nr:TolC family outer membrane protein [Alphaproteobacteria bacterium]
MNRNNQKLLTVCASALLALSSSYANAQGNILSNRTSGEFVTLPAGTAPVVDMKMNPALTSPSVSAAPAKETATKMMKIEPATGNEDVPPVLGERQNNQILRVNDAPESLGSPILTGPASVAVNENTPAQPTSYPARGTDRIVTLRDAVSVGVLTNPTTESVANNRRATDEELQQAKALYLPSVDMAADTGFQSINSDPDGQVEGHSDLYRSQASLTLTQMLFDGFSTKYENERQHHRVRSAAHRVRESAEFSGLTIIEAYLDVLRQRELLAIADENLKMHNDIMSQIVDSANAGRTTQADVEQTKARLNAAEAQKAAVQESLRNADTNYRRIVGDNPQPDIQVPVVPRQLIEPDVDTEVKQALTHSPTLDTKEADVNVADAERRATKSTFYPKVDFQAGVSAGSNLDGVDGRTKSASALVVANWNLYRGGGDEARSREFIYRLAQAKDERNNAARTLEQDVRRTWASMVSAGERALAFRKQAEANGTVVEAYKDQFNLDRRTLLDVLDSQNEWFVSRSNAINNGYLEMFAIYRLLALRGDLLPTLGVSYPREASPEFTSRKKG